MKILLLKAFSGLAVAPLALVGASVPFGILEVPLRGYAPVLFYFSLIVLLLTLTLSRLGIFFSGLVRERAGQSPSTAGYASEVLGRFVWPSATLLLTGCFLFAASFLVQAG